MATQKFLDQNGLQTFWAKIKATIASSVSALQGNAVLKTGDHTMEGKLTAQGGFAGNLTGKADTAGTADKTKASLSIVIKKADGTTATTTFNGSTAATATVDMSTLATDAELDAVVEALGAEIDAKIASVEANNELITATTSTDKKVTIGPTNKLTTAVGLAEAAVRSVTNGSTNGYITVNTGGTSTNIQVADFSSYATTEVLNNSVNGLSGSIYTNSQEIASIKSAVSGGTHFIGISTSAITDGGTENPTIGGSQKTAANGDIVIYGNKEFIWNGTAWEELGDTTAESDRISALETWKDTASQTISSNSAGVTAAAAGVTANATAIVNLSKAVVTSFEGKTGAISVDTAASTITEGTATGNGKATVDFSVSSAGKMTGEVALPSQIWINKGNIENLTNSHNSLSGTVNTLSGTVSTINSNYAGKDVAMASISTTSSVSSGATVSIAATGNITTWTITPENVNGVALTTAQITIESIPDSWIEALS